jgi:hypothetical protein
MNNPVDPVRLIPGTQKRKIIGLVKTCSKQVKWMILLYSVPRE